MSPEIIIITTDSGQCREKILETTMGLVRKIIIKDQITGTTIPTMLIMIGAREIIIIVVTMNITMGITMDIIGGITIITGTEIDIIITKGMVIIIIIIGISGMNIGTPAIVGRIKPIIGLRKTPREPGPIKGRAPQIGQQEQTTHGRNPFRLARTKTANYRIKKSKIQTRVRKFLSR